MGKFDFFSVDVLFFEIELGLYFFFFHASIHGKLLQIGIMFQLYYKLKLNTFYNTLDHSILIHPKN